MKLIGYIKQLNYRHYVAAAITLAFAALGVFVFPGAFGRLIESVRDFGLSMAYFVCDLFELPFTPYPTVTEFAKIPFFGADVPDVPSEPTAPLPQPVPLPSTLDKFLGCWDRYWELWTSPANAIGYVSVLFNVLYHISYGVLIFLPLLISLYALFLMYFRTHNNAYNVDSKQLRMYKAFVVRTVVPVKRIVFDFISFVRARPRLYTAWIVLWAYYFNAFTIVIEFFAYYFYFVVSFDVVGVYRQAVKLVVDLTPMFNFIPPLGWIILSLLLFDWFRKSIALTRLKGFEAHDREFIKSRPILFMVCGTMGKKKTTAITDMALSQEVMFRDKAFEKILENDLKFPNFPWINLENALKRAIANHSVYNLATVRRFVRSKRLKFLRRRRKRRPLRHCIFDYDFERYGCLYDNKLYVEDVWQVIETYSQLYFIYIIQSSLLISNYSIRSDMVLDDVGNFPLWNGDFFRRDSRLLDSFSRHAHILDFDTLRLGKRLLADNAAANSFEFGVVVITEIGKERGNKNDMEGVKRLSDEANQKNDGLNKCLKMIRHSATVDYFPFVSIITDEQRPDSWGADARELCDIVTIRESGKPKLAMPFFLFGEILYSLVFSKFVRMYYEYRHVRGDNTLLMHVMKGIVSAIHRYYTGIYNRFGFNVLELDVERGTRDGELEPSRYLLMNKKIYPRRFSTDCFSEYFAEKAMRSPVGLNDLYEYASEKATFHELRFQNSYFIQDLSNILLRQS